MSKNMVNFEDEYGNTQFDIEKDMIICSIMLDGKTSFEDAEKQAIKELKEIYEDEN
jgi:hypothetical protein